jgi:hypothetical protein
MLVVPAFSQDTLTNASIVKMVQSGVAQDAVVKAIAEAPSVDFTFLTLDYLTKSGVPDAVVRAMAARTYGRPIPGYKPTLKEAPAATPVAIAKPSSDGNATENAAEATVYVYRSRALVDLASSPTIYCDGAQVKRLENGTFLSWNIPAGKHEIKAGPTQTGQTVEFEAGKKYFFKFNHENFVVSSITRKPASTLSPVPEDDATAQLKKLKQVTLQ